MFTFGLTLLVWRGPQINVGPVTDNLAAQGLLGEPLGQPGYWLGGPETWEPDDNLGAGGGDFLSGRT